MQWGGQFNTQTRLFCGLYSKSGTRKEICVSSLYRTVVLFKSGLLNGTVVEQYYIPKSAKLCRSLLLRHARIGDIVSDRMCFSTSIGPGELTEALDLAIHQLWNRFLFTCCISLAMTLMFQQTGQCLGQLENTVWFPCGSVLWKFRQRNLL